MKTKISRLLLFLLTFIALTMQAQNYEAEWKAVAKASNGDLPQTALTHVRNIRDKAAAEGNQPQLLRALCTELTLAHEISPDSDAVVTKRIEAAMADCEKMIVAATTGAEKERRMTDKVMWQYALGRISKNTVHLLAALENTELLGKAKAADYVPALEIGADSYCFNGDLLSLLTLDLLQLPRWTYKISDAEKLDAITHMRDYYKEQKNDLAVLMTDYFYDVERSSQTNVGEMISRIRTQLPQIKKLDALHKGSVAKRLQQWVDEKELPTVNAHFDNSKCVYPGETSKVAVSSKNIKEIVVNVYRVNGMSNETFDDEVEAAKFLSKKGSTNRVATYTKTLQHAPAYETFEDSLDIKLPEPGIYIVQLVADGHKASTEWVHVSAVVPTFFNFASAKGKVGRVHLLDARTGRPYTENVSAKVRRIRSYNASASAWKVLQPQADGSFDVSEYGNYEYEIAVKASSDCYTPVKAITMHAYYNEGRRYDTFSQIYTDRAIYRPGQKVQVGGFVYQRNSDVYKAVEAWKGEMILRNTKGEEVAKRDVLTDEFGIFSGEFQLPDHVIPGKFHVFLRGSDVRNSQYFSVEEYKRPTFRITLEPTDSKDVTGKDRWEVGDDITVRGKVETYSGVPVPDVTVQWKTDFSHWYWFDDENEEKNESPLEGTVKTDEKGCFAFTYHITKSGRYTTEIEATASNGETNHTRHYVHAGQATEVRVQENGAEKKPELFTCEYSKDHSEATVKLDFAALPETATRPVWLFYSLTSSKGGILEHECREIADETATFTLKWKEEYGDGAELHLLFVKEGVFRASVEVERPKPDKRLLLEWSTFRDHLQPGEQETWTLSVKRPDGTPVSASVMARLYDASLDAFNTNPWNLKLYFYRNMPSVNTSIDFLHLPWSLGYTANYKMAPELKMSAWAPTMFDYFRNYLVVGYGGKARAKNSVMLYDMAESKAMPMMAAKNVAAGGTAGAAAADTADEGVMMDDAEDVEEAKEYNVRENFDETAFFYPAIRTDEAGNATINFTLPESLTQWNFTAIATTRGMNYGVLNDTIFAQKKLMAEIAAPRFLRVGDVTDMPVTVRNVSGETCKTDIIILITDAATGRVLLSKKETVTLEDGKYVTKTIPVKATTDFSVRVVAKSKDFSDGEERLVPVLSNRETVQTTVPFSTTAAGTVTVDLSALNLQKLMKQDAECQPVLTVEYCENPIWNVIRVLPTLLDDKAFCVTDWATQLYAIDVADFLSQKLQDTASKALVDSLLSTKDIPALYSSAYGHLKDYQHGDGGFVWVKGFGSSLWMTADVAILLARLRTMTGNTRTGQMLEMAMDYLDGKADKIVEEMKRHKTVGISEVMLRYLYARQLMGRENTKTTKYLLERAAEENKDLTMYGKSVVAQILKKAKPEVSELALRSLIEHTVSTDEMGRYFDTERAFGSWTSYKIPTQTMAIESLDEIAEIDGKNAQKLQDEMKLWLLQSKRTQKWESNRASADATYALLHGDCNPSAAANPFQSLAPEGYSSTKLTVEESRQVIRKGSYNIKKETNGLSWGAVFADYTLPIDQVEQSSAGFTLTRKWEVLRDGKWTEISGKVKIGEHVRQTLTLRAERDYDFVQVEASRAACLEPLHPLSGTTWMGGTFCYRMVRDSSNDYYFEHLAKGTHTFTEELIVDRAGTFANGIARVKSTYAPEFGGYAPSTPIIAISE